MAFSPIVCVHLSLSLFLETRGCSKAFESSNPSCPLVWTAEIERLGRNNLVCGTCHTQIQRKCLSTSNGKMIVDPTAATMYCAVFSTIDYDANRLALNTHFFSYINF